MIRSIPVAQHSEEVEANFWQPIFAKAGQLPLWGAIFGGLPSIRLTRDRLLNHPYPSNEHKCAEILLWGYPRNLNQVVTNALPNLAVIAGAAPVLANWPAYFQALNAIGGINISSITKFAYFYSHIFSGQPALILDLQLIAKTARWQEVTIPGLAYHNARKNYLAYLQAMHTAAAAIHCAGDQLEFFLFALGDSF
jgi:hypothetical protein